MNPIELAQLVFLAALWGGSFLFIRVGVTDFGVAPLMALRVGIGALFLRDPFEHVEQQVIDRIAHRRYPAFTFT